MTQEFLGFGLDYCPISLFSKGSNVAPMRGDPTCYLVMSLDWNSMICFLLLLGSLMVTFEKSPP